MTKGTKGVECVSAGSPGVECGSGGSPPPQLHVYPPPPGLTPGDLEGIQVQDSGDVVVPQQIDINKIEDCLVPNVVACVLCCWVWGSWAIMRSVQTRVAKLRGDRRDAWYYSLLAKDWFGATVFFGLFTFFTTLGMRAAYIYSTTQIETPGSRK